MQALYQGIDPSEVSWPSASWVSFASRLAPIAPIKYKNMRLPIEGCSLQEAFVRGRFHPSPRHRFLLPIPTTATQAKATVPA
jgi:hypothetical protein